MVSWIKGGGGWGGVVNSPSCIIMHGYVKYPCMGTRGGGGGGIVWKERKY